MFQKESLALQLLKKKFTSPKRLKVAKNEADIRELR